MTTQAARPRLLFLCQNLPYPPHGGALIRSYHTLRLLSEHFDVTALFFHHSATTDGPEAVRQGVEELSKLSRAVAFRVPQDGNVPRYIWDHFRSVLSRRVYVRWMYESSEARRTLAKLLSENSYDLIHIDSLDLVAFLPRLPRVPTVVAHHNVESELLMRRASMEKGLRRHYMRMQAAFMEGEERTWCPRVALNLVCSAEDEATLGELAPEARCVVVPNGVDTKALVPKEGGANQGIVFVGGYSWFPNRDGMEYFADDILPKIRRRLPDVQVTWVGRGASERVERGFLDQGVRMTGWVDDMRPIVQDSACAIVPLRVGGGTRLKILDAWSLGKAVVSTSPGCEGLNVQQGENMLVADDAATFASAVIRVLTDDGLRSRLEQGGRTTAVEHYDWSAIGETLLNEYEALLR